MTDATSAKSSHRHHWRRELVELAALFTAVAVADAVANTIAHGPSGPVLLCCSAVVLIATAAFHTWWARRHENAPPPTDTGAAAPRSPGAPQEERRETALWRMRTTVRDEPGSLAALCTALAEHRVDILNLQTHPLSDGTVDEFLLRAPAALLPADLTRTVAAAGGAHTWLERADAHDLVDAPTRILGMATRTALDSAELPLALRQLLGRCTIRSVPARTRNAQRDTEPVPEEGILEEHTMTFRDPSGGSVTIERPHLPFTPPSSRGYGRSSSWTPGSASGCRRSVTCSRCPRATPSRCAARTPPTWRRPARCTTAARPGRWRCATRARSPTPSAI